MLPVLEIIEVKDVAKDSRFCPIKRLWGFDMSYHSLGKFSQVACWKLWETISALPHGTLRSSCEVLTIHSAHQENVFGIPLNMHVFLYFFAVGWLGLWSMNVWFAHLRGWYETNYWFLEFNMDHENWGLAGPRLGDFLRCIKVNRSGPPCAIAQPAKLAKINKVLQKFLNLFL